MRADRQRELRLARADAISRASCYWSAEELVERWSLMLEQLTLLPGKADGGKQGRCGLGPVLIDAARYAVRMPQAGTEKRYSAGPRNIPSRTSSHSEPE